MSMDLTEYTLRGVAALPKQEVRNWISALEQYIAEMPEALPAESCPVKHIFAPGLYAREMTIPSGMLLIGKMHRKDHICTLSEGTIVVLTEDGVRKHTAPCSFVSVVGDKRVGYALTRTVWTTYHVTNKTDLAEIEAEVIAHNYADIELEGV